MYIAGQLTLLQLSYPQVHTCPSVRFEQLYAVCASTHSQHKPSQQMNACVSKDNMTCTDDTLLKWQ